MSGKRFSIRLFNASMNDYLPQINGEYFFLFQLIGSYFYILEEIISDLSNRLSMVLTIMLFFSIKLHHHYHHNYQIILSC